MKHRNFQLNFATMMFYHFIKHYRKYILAILSLILLHLTQTQIPRLILDIDHEINKNHTMVLIFKFLGIAAGVILFRTISRWYFFYPARTQQCDLRDELLTALSESNPKHWSQNSTGKLYQLLVTDLEQIRAFVGFASLQLANLAIALIIMLPAMNAISTELLYSLIPLGVTFIIFSFSLMFTTNMANKGRQEHDVLQQMLVEFYDAKKSLNTFCKEESAAVEFSNQSSKELKYFYWANFIRSFTRPFLLLGGALSTLYAAYLVHKLQYPMSYLVAYGSFIFLLFEPLTYLSWIGIIAAETKVSWVRLKSLMSDITTGVIEKKINVTADSLQIEIDLFQQSKLITLDFGKIYLLFGPTAGGKTTFLHQLQTQAQLINLSSILVPQEPYLFNQTLRENLFLSFPVDSALEKKAHDLLKLFELDNLSQKAEDVLDIQVGEKGKKLSGGQVKRVHLIRSLLFDYKVILWDDPFSAVDVLTEKRILNYLIDNNYFLNKLVLISTHRISTMKYGQHGIYTSRTDFIINSLTDSSFYSLTMDFFKKLNKEKKNE